MGNTFPASPDLSIASRTLILPPKADLRYLHNRPSDSAQILHVHSPYRRPLAHQVSSRSASISSSYCNFCVDSLSVTTATSRGFAYCGRTADPFDFPFGTLVRPTEPSIPTKFRVHPISRSCAIAIFALSCYFSQLHFRTFSSIAADPLIRST